MSKAGGTQANTTLGHAVRKARPDITARAAANRSYQALLRLEDAGKVVRSGKLWALAQAAWRRTLGQMVVCGD